jgi:F0F1-type ATP synthase epsilon subunit
MSVLKAGNVTVDDLDGKRSIVPISGGFLSFDEDTITVIADSDAPDGRES